MTQVTDQLLREITDRIVEEVNPLQIVLFGSHARGDADPESDLDLLVVQDGPFGPQHSRRAAMVKLWRLLRNIPIPKDFLVYTAEELEKWGGDRNHIISRALREGKVLYERH